MNIRILLVDDHHLFLAGLVALLESEPELNVIGQAQDGRKALRMARELRPDVVVMDVQMPGLNGIDATRQIAAELSGVKVLCLSMYGAARFVEAALEAGASGYILKDSALEDLVRAIVAVTAGGTYLSPGVAGTVIDVLKGHRPLANASAFTALTEREREVLQLLAEGCPTKRIASRLHISPKTVYTHREQIMDKLDIHSVAGLTKYAILEGLTSNEPENLQDEMSRG